MNFTFGTPQEMQNVIMSIVQRQPRENTCYVFPRFFVFTVVNMNQTRGFLCVNINTKIRFLKKQILMEHYYFNITIITRELLF